MSPPDQQVVSERFHRPQDETRRRSLDRWLGIGKIDENGNIQTKDSSVQTVDWDVRAT